MNGKKKVNTAVPDIQVNVLNSSEKKAGEFFFRYLFLKPVELQMVHTLIILLLLAPSAAVLSGSALFAKSFLCETLMFDYHVLQG